MSALNLGAKVVCRCPKCGNRNLRIYEVFEVSDITFVSEGVVKGTECTEYPRATGAVYMLCEDCEHRWRSRRSMGEMEGDAA